MEARSLAIGYEGTAAVVVDFSSVFEAGTITVIAGPNGSGKSTIIKCLARQLKPISGEVVIDGSNIWDLSSKSFATKVSYVPQSVEPSQDLTVEEMVMLGRNPHQPWWSWQVNEADLAAATKAMERTGVASMRHKYLLQLSGGERQRALIACALAQQTKYLLLDEPTAHLDFRYQLELMQLCRELKEQGLCIITVLHDLNLIARIADQVVLLSKDKPEEAQLKSANGNGRPSRIAAKGSTGEILTRQTISEVFDVDVSILDDPESSTSVYVLHSKSAT